MQYLRNQPATTPSLVLDFRQVEEILGFRLPNSARKHRPWWANDATHSQAVWFKAGWKVSDVDIRAGRVTFGRGAPGLRSVAPPERKNSEVQHRAQQSSGVASLAAKRNFSGYGFARVCLIQPECDQDGQPRQYLPQGEYSNARGLPLHRYGAGPFCRFRIPADLHVGGVYLLALNDSVCYVGECENLSLRFNIGYGQISPRNRYEGGQQTNCRLNHLILEALRGRHRIELWFHEASDRQAVERRLIANLAPPWNNQGKL